MRLFSIFQAPATEPEISRPAGGLAFGGRQIAALMFVATVIVGVAAAVAVLAARATGEARRTPVRTSPAGRPLVVDAPNPAPPSSAAVTTGETAPLPAIPAEPLGGEEDAWKGLLFFQVGALTPREADAAADRLRQQGWEVRLGKAPATGLRRVLVGPVAREDAARVGKALEDGGWTGFPRRY